MNKTDIILLLFHLDKVSKSWLFTSGVIDLLSKSIPCKNVPFRMVYSGWSLEFQNKDRTKNSVPLPVEIPSKKSNNQFWMGTKKSMDFDKTTVSRQSSLEKLPGNEFE